MKHTMAVMCTMNKTIIQTTIGMHEVTDSDRILVHEHVFNRYPFWQQSKMEEYVLSELQKAYKQGITVICDLTAYTKPYNYYKIIEQSPVKIVSCLGFYTPRYISAQQKKQDASTLLQSCRKAIENGIGSKKIKPGILKIAAQSYELGSLEKKFFSVVAQLSTEYNLPIALHAPKGTYSHVCSLISAGAKPNRIFAAHIETGIASKDEYKKRMSEAVNILALGSYIQLADFGCTMTSKKGAAGVSFVSEIINRGYLNQLLLSADSCWRWKNNGFVVKEYNYGEGKHYTYTMEHILSLLGKAGDFIDLEQILLCDNPRHFFAQC